MNSRRAGLAFGLAWGERVAWLAALVAVGVVLAASRYESRDPDSALHTAIAADLASLPVTQWIAPTWNGHWGLQGLYREHPAGIFILPALLARLGYPAPQAAQAVNAAYQLLTLLLMTALARRFLARRDARLLVTLLLLLPISFTYRVRANQEQPLLMCLLAAFYGIERSRDSLRWAALAAAGLAGVFLVKGVFVVVAVAGLGAFLLVGEWRWPSRPNRVRPWLALGIGLATLAVAYVAYDAVYRHAAGEPFFAWYLGRQFGVASAAATVPRTPGVLVTFVWYLGRIAWFTAPWIIVAGAALWLRAAQHRQRKGRWESSEEHEGRARGAVLCAVLAVVYVIAFSAFQRRAERYVFPVYFALAAWWAAYGFRAFPSIRRSTWRLSRACYPYEQAILWLLLVGLAMLAPSLNLPRIKLWR